MAGRSSPIIRMKSVAKLKSPPPLFETRTEVIEHDAVGVKTFTIRAVHRNKLRRQVQNLLELHFLLPNLVLGRLAFSDVCYSADKLTVSRCILNRVGDRMDVFNSSASQQQAILMFEVRASLGCAVDDLLYKHPILGMCPLQRSLYCRLHRGLIVEDAIGFV